MGDLLTEAILIQEQLTMGIRVEQIDSSYLKKAFPIGASLP